MGWGCSSLVEGFLCCPEFIPPAPKITVIVIIDLGNVKLDYV